MGEINLRAAYLLIGSRGEIRREMLLMRGAVFGIFVCACALLSRKMLILPSLAGLILFSYFYFAERLYISGKIYFLSGEITDSPSSLMRFSVVIRYIRLKITVWGVKLLWLNFFMLPSRIIGVIIIRTLYMTGNIQRVMLYTLILAFFVLTLIGLLYYLYLSGRYCLSELLFVRSTMQRPLEILRSSAIFTEKELFHIMFFGIKSTFTGRVTAEMRRALFCSGIFSDRKFYKNYGIMRPLTFREPF